MKTLIILAILPLMAIILLAGTCCKSAILKAPLEDKNDISKILHYASLALSSQNSQTWKVKVFN